MRRTVPTSARTGGVTFCLTCGGWSAHQSRKLRAGCKPATPTGCKAIRRLTSRQLPQGLLSWPSGELALLRERAARQSGVGPLK
eukprot:7754191-Pyramimonas_sp.AAC.1